MQKVVFYANANELFSQQGIPDGISIVMKDSKKKSLGFTYIYLLDGNRIEVEAANPGDDLMPLNPLDVQIVGKINEFIIANNLTFLHDAIFPRTLFGIESNFVEENPSLVREYTTDNDVDFAKEVKLFTNDKAGKSGRARWYVTEKKNITSGTQYLDMWKVVVSSANAGGQKRSNQLAVLDNHSAFGRARVALKVFSTEAEAKNFYKYVKSELIRFAFLMTDESLTSLAKQVPDLQDYSNDNPYLDFSENINAQLYDLFHIDHQAQHYIRDVLAKKAE